MFAIFFFSVIDAIIDMRLPPSLSMRLLIRYDL